jgi:hypothetical protein
MVDGDAADLVKQSVALTDAHDALVDMAYDRIQAICPNDSCFRSIERMGIKPDQ